MNKVRIDAIATSAYVNKDGILNLDVSSAKTIPVGEIEFGKELPGYDDRI